MPVALFQPLQNKHFRKAYKLAIILGVEKSPSLTMSAVSRRFQAHCCIRSEPSAISL